MALDPNQTAPCTLLNATSFPSLFVSNSSAESIAYPRIAANGVLKKYVDSLNGSEVTMTNSILSSTGTDASSKFRLIQFLSGAGISSASSTAGTPGSGSPGSGPGSGSTTGSANPSYSTLGAVVLKNSSGQNQGIVDTYIAPIVPTYYNPTFTTTASIVSDSQFWATSDVVDGMPIGSPTSILGKLIKDGHLLSEAQIYKPSQLVAGTIPPAVNTESLIYLYNHSQRTTLSAAQVTLQAKLEATNLKFFGAFMVEYCFYRTRYEWLLSKFFEIYSKQGTADNAYQTSQSVAVGALFPAGRATDVSQQDYLSALTDQLAYLNMRLSDMRTLLSKINIYYNGVFLNIQENMNSSNADGSNAKLRETITALQTSATKANKYMTETDFAQEAMKYNSEKNRYSNILLGLYAFLNIAALATVYQLARG